MNKTEKSKSKISAIISNIQRFSVHDGTGIRTLIFFKGCPMECAWCSNPETQSPHIQVMQTKINCMHCNKCIDICPQNALKLKEGVVISKPQKCDLCGKCEEICPTNNIKLVGMEYSIDELVEIILRDKVFYSRTDGGVTYSGGEPTTQIRFLIELSKKLKSHNINIGIETCGYFNLNDFKKLLPYLDVIYFDLKVINDEKHKKFTGQSNKVVLNNLKKLKDIFNNIIIRLPLIPGYTDDDENIYDIINMLKEINIKRIDILPYHRLGAKKYVWMDKDYELDRIEPKQALERSDEVKKIFESKDFAAIIGG